MEERRDFIPGKFKKNKVGILNLSPPPFLFLGSGLSAKNRGVLFLSLFALWKSGLQNVLYLDEDVCHISGLIVMSPFSQKILALAHIIFVSNKGNLLPVPSALGMW